jgi:hypothetical protein
MVHPSTQWQGDQSEQRFGGLERAHTRPEERGQGLGRCAMEDRERAQSSL